MTYHYIFLFLNVANGLCEVRKSRTVGHTGQNLKKIGTSPNRQQGLLILKYT